MKAKEIVAEILKITDHGCPPNEAFARLLTKEMEEMRGLNAQRKGGDAAWLRVIRETNTKWNSVIRGVNESPHFQCQGKTWLREDDFARMVLSLSSHPSDEAQVRALTAPTTISNKVLADARSKAQEEEYTREEIMRFVFGAPK